MITSIAILVLSTALFLFYIQTLCERILGREFSRPYFEEVLSAIDLEFPRVGQALSGNVPMKYTRIRLALKCDFSTLTYLVKNGDPKRRHLSWQEKMLIGYFHILVLCFPLFHAFRFGERQSVMKLTAILNHFANLVGERVSLMSASSTAANLQS